MPPQFPLKPSSFVAGKKPSPLAAVSSPFKKIARPTSAPNLTALSASASKTTAPAKRIARPASSSSLALASNSKPRPPSSSKITPDKPARPAAVSLAAPRRATVSVHPARRLTCGTAVSVRTRYVNITDRCSLVIWLPARVVSASDAYHYTVKYAADLHAMFAGKVVRLPVDHVREAPHRAAAAAAAKVEQSKKPEEPNW